MLSERDEQVLNQIERGLLLADPRFVAAMRVGRPRPPREYRRGWSVLLVVLAVLAFGTVVTTGNPVALLVLLGIGIVGLARFVSRRFDEV
jgi:hypothetical protein